MLDFIDFVGLNWLLLFLDHSLGYFLYVGAVHCVEWVGLDYVDDFISLFLFSDPTLLLVNLQNSLRSADINPHVADDLFNILSVLNHPIYQL